jgi:hypothetical protein
LICGLPSQRANPVLMKNVTDEKVTMIINDDVTYALLTAG